MKPHFLTIVFAAVPGIALALGLGEANDPVYVGEPLSVRIPLLGSDAAGLGASCVSLRPVPGDFAEKRLVDATLTLERDALVLRTPRAVTQPLISFRIRIDCGANLAKDFQLLPYPPRSRAVVAPAVPAAAATPAAPAAAAPPGAAPAPVGLPLVPPAGAVADAGGQLVATPTTLRLMSRQRYPEDSAARVAYIHRVAAANPGIFPSVKAAFDQPLAAGTRLRMPDNLPAKTARPKARPRPGKDVQTPAARRGDTSQGRLIIGANDLPTRNAVELSEDLDRLVKAMTEQVQIEIAMAERLKKMEAEIEQAKLAVVQQQAETQRMARELRELREDQRIANYVQLVLAILLGGVAVAAVMLWRGQQRVRAPTNIDYAFPAPQAVARPAPAASAMPSEKELHTLFDDLLPPK